MNAWGMLERLCAGDRTTGGGLKTVGTCPKALDRPSPEKEIDSPGPPTGTGVLGEKAQELSQGAYATGAMTMEVNCEGI